MFNIATNFCFYLDQNHKRAVELFLLLNNIEQYLNGAIIEMGRLERIRKNMHKEMRGWGKCQSKRKNNQIVYLAGDAHFYFICIDKICKNLARLAKELNDQDIKKLNWKIKTIINIHPARNHLEHIDARSLGFKNKRDERKGVKKHIMDFGNFIGDDFSFDGIKYTSSKKSLDEIKKIYKKLIEILHKKYANNN